MQLFREVATLNSKKYKFFYSLKLLKKRPQKLLIIGPIFFSIANRPKSAQITFSFP